MSLVQKYSWLTGFPKDNWVEFLIATGPTNLLTSNKQKKPFLSAWLDEIDQLISAGKIGQCLNVIALGLYIDKEYFLEYLKKEGILRYSSYLGNRNPVPGIAKYLLHNSTFFKLSKAEQLYFTSLINFEQAFVYLNKLNRLINEELAKFPKSKSIAVNGRTYKVSRLKALLAINELNFITGKDGAKLIEDQSSYDFYSKEEISEAISFLIHRYKDLHGFKPYDLQLIDEAFINNGAGDLIVKACQFKAIKELEIELEAYGYECILDQGKMIIRHPDPNFEKSLVISNVQYYLQNQANHYYNYINHKDTLLLMDVAKAFDEASSELFVLKTEPFPRYILYIPPQLFTHFLGEKKMMFFREEFSILESIERELMISIDKLDTYDIVDGLSFYEFIRLLRFFIIHSFLINVKYDNLIRKVDDALLFRSVIPVIKKEDLVMYLSMISTKEQVQLFLDIISWSVDSQNGDYLDLQYKPLLSYNEYYMFGFSVAGQSNLTRNVFLSQSKTGNNIKVQQVTNHTPIPDVLSEIFNQRGFLTRKDVSVTYKGTLQSESDIDFLAYKDGLLIIAECKDSLHPIDLFEMRTTLNHFKKATNQIKFLLEALSDESFLAIFCARIGINRLDLKIIQPVIVQSNNKFWGFEFEGIPVRNYRELEHFMKNGYWNFRFDEAGLAQFKLWDSDTVSVQDIIRFCSPDSPHSAMYKACNLRQYKLSEKLYRETYSLVINDALDDLKDRYTYERVSIPT